MGTGERILKRIMSWNVNGLRAVHRKGFKDWLEGCGAGSGARAAGAANGTGIVPEGPGK